jgi:hypothetical protein
MTNKRRSGLGLAVVAIFALVLIAVLAAEPAMSRTSAAKVVDLKKLCGDTVSVQTDWFPSLEHGALYQLAGVGGSYDTKKGRYTGRIKGTNLNLEVRAGGPFAGFQQPISQMYQDPTITLGYVSSDEAIRNSGNLPVVSVVTPMEFSPQILYWNPQKLNINNFADIGKSGSTVLYFEGGAYVDYLVGRGWVKQSQLDGSYDGSPNRFITTDGNIVQQGFVTSEPYYYKHVYTQYGKDVKFLLIKNSGFIPYPQAISIRRDNLAKMTPCLKKLVPLLQKAELDYLAKPLPVINKLIEYVTAMNTFWHITQADALDNVAKQKQFRLVQNGPDCTIGNFNMKRGQQVINQLVPIYKAKNLTTVKDGLKATDIFTNAFVNPRIGFKTAKCK